MIQPPCYKIRNLVYLVLINNSAEPHTKLYFFLFGVLSRLHLSTSIYLSIYLSISIYVSLYIYGSIISLYLAVWYFVNILDLISGLWCLTIYIPEWFRQSWWCTPRSARIPPSCSWDRWGQQSRGGRQCSSPR